MTREPDDKLVQQARSMWPDTLPTVPQLILALRIGYFRAQAIRDAMSRDGHGAQCNDVGAGGLLAGKEGQDSGTGLLEWLRGKIAEAEQAVRAREQAEATWRCGDDASWAAAAAMHPSTAGQPPRTRADRLKLAASQGRIAEKCRYELEMFKAVFDMISRTTPTLCPHCGRPMEITR